MRSFRHRVFAALALAGLAAGVFGCSSDGGSGADADDSSATRGVARVVAGLESSAAAKRTRNQELAPLDVAAVDHHGNKVDEALGVTESLCLDLPWGRDYVLIFADAEGLLGAMVYGGKEQSRFSVEPGVLALDLGQIVVDPKHRTVRLKDPRKVKPPKDDDDGDDHDDDESDDDGMGPGDAAMGADLWAVYCAGCHPAGLEKTSVAEIAEALREGEGEMPAFPDLAPHAADLAAYLKNPVISTDTDGDGVSDDLDSCPGVVGNGPDGCPVSPPTDTDGDGVTDELDACPDVAGAGADGCPLPPTDTDGDGVPDDLDPCPEVAAATADGCPLPPVDTDGDGVTDDLDACPDVAGDGADGCPVATPTRPAILDTTCQNCHGDYARRVSCTNSQWPRHDGSRTITAAQFQEVSVWATGKTCP